MSSAILQRSRRTTAGKRLASLIGQAAEDDDAFWSHKIWSEGGGGFSSGKKDGDTSEDSGSDSSDESDGEGSYHASDEDPDAAVDQFDSDFNESESSSDEEDAEAELLAQERKDKKATHFAATPAGRKLPSRPSGKGRGAVKAKRVLGEGWNSGLVLNWFPSGDGSGAISSSAPPQTSSHLPSNVALPAAAPQPPLQSSVSKIQSVSASVQPATTDLVAPIHPQTSPNGTKLLAAPILPTESSVQTQVISSQPIIPTKAITARPASPNRKRNLRAGTLSQTISAVQQSAISQKETMQRSAAAKDSLKQGKRQFTQEEMILEALKETEVENNKWLLGRKRRKEMVEEEVKQNSSVSSGNVVERFYSRRGGCNVISFMDMERLPEILSRPQHPTIPKGGSPKRKRSNSEGSKNSHASPSRVAPKCVITGKEARYRDPKTMLGYHDLEAFKELRRRSEAGLLPSKGAKSTSGKKRQSLPKSKTIMASTSSKASVKVVVTQNGTPVSPPEMPSVVKSNGIVKTEAVVADGNNFPTKKPPIFPEGVSSSNIVHTDSKVALLKEMDFQVAALTNQTAAKSELSSVQIPSDNKNNTTTFAPSRKSPRKPKPSAKVLAEVASSTRLLPSDTMNIAQHRAKTTGGKNNGQHTGDRGDLPSDYKGFPDKNNNGVPNFVNDLPLAKTSAVVTIRPREPADKPSTDPTSSNGAEKQIEKTNELHSKNGSSENANLSSGKEIVA